MFSYLSNFFQGFFCLFGNLKVGIRKLLGARTDLECVVVDEPKDFMFAN